jgi:quinoprotein glucose dehydrogenase
LRRCHGSDRKGSPPPFPSLVDSKLTEAEMTDVPMVPGQRCTAKCRLFRGLLAGDLKACSADFAAATDKTELAAPASDDRPPYRFTAIEKFLDPDGYPAVAPPWGT